MLRFGGILEIIDILFFLFMDNKIGFIKCDDFFKVIYIYLT